MTLKEILSELKSLGNEKMFLQNRKKGIGENQFGVKLGDIRKLAKKTKTDHKLALSLWGTENLEARFLSTLIIETNKLSFDEMDKMVRSTNHERIADWLNSYVVKNHPDNEKLRVKWLESDNPMALRAGWNLTSIKVTKKSKDLNVKEILDKIESGMLTASTIAQWTMNFTLGHIGIYFPEFRKRAIEIGEKLGVYRDYPVSKGCTSPFVPIWVNEMVKRQG